MLSFYKSSPDNYAIKFKNGAVRQHGRGISFFFFNAFSTVLEVPATTITSPFIFNETTANFQDVTLQGAVTYRISDPLVASERFDFSRQQWKKPAGDGREKLNLMVINTIQSHARAKVSTMPLETVLKEVGSLATILSANIVEDTSLATIGVQIEGIHFGSTRAQPDVQKALQTEYREKIQRQADLAIYARRSAAVENEKEIKERELATEIELASRRKQLVETEAENTIRMAQADAEASQLKLGVFKGVAPSVMASMALKDWAERGGSVSNLTVTGDMLTDILAAFNTKAK
jgi:SPFH domain / Band 7 family